MRRQTVTVKKFFEEHGEKLSLTLVAGASHLERILQEPTINRPGLALTGFTKFFAFERLQLFGNADASYLESLPQKDRQDCYTRLLAYRIPCMVFSRGLEPDKLLLAEVERVGVPMFTTPLLTSKFINHATLALEMMFAPRGTEMGSMVDILGIGVIIQGESGIGKSESVLALIERGYSLVADDITRVVLEDGKDVIGTSAEITRNHMEVRGIGIIDVAAMFGVKSIRSNKRVDLVVCLKAWQDVPDVDRVGMDQQYVQILGVAIPHITIPVKPGRDLARLIEVAAFHMKLKMAGHNPAQALNERLISEMANPGKQTR